MAQVRMSVKLKDAIRANANKLYEGRIEEARKQNPTWPDRLYDAWLRDGNGDIIEFIQERGDAYVNMYLTFETGYNIEKIGDKTPPYRHFGMAVPRHLPKTAERYYNANLTISFDAGREILQEMEAHAAEVNDLEAQRTTFINRVVRVCDSVITLRQALKIWPQLKALTPQWALDEMNRKVTRAKSAEKPEGIDDSLINELNVGLVAGTLLAG